MSHFTLLEIQNLPDWIQDIIKIAKGKARKYSWSHFQREMCSSFVSRENQLTYQLGWSFDLDDLIDEGCLAYIKALNRPNLKNPAAYARTMARYAMSELILKEGRSHGLVRDVKNGGLKLATGIYFLRYNKKPMGRAAINAAKTHCMRGHEFTPENTLVVRDGTKHLRRCKSCRRLRDEATFGKRKAQRHLNYLKHKELKQAAGGAVQDSFLLEPQGSDSSEVTRKGHRDARAHVVHEQKENRPNPPKKTWWSSYLLNV